LSTLELIWCSILYTRTNTCEKQKCAYMRIFVSQECVRARVHVLSSMHMFDNEGRGSGYVR
jgi:hypothetical protein